MSQGNALVRYQSSAVTDPHTAQGYYNGRELQVYTPQSNRFPSSTTNKDVYVQHKLPRRLPPPESYKRPSPPLEASTTYGRHFPYHQIESKPPNRPHTAVACTTPFEGRSSYADTFVKHEISVPSRPAPLQPRPAVKFDGSSTYHDSFPRHTIESSPHREISRPSANKIRLDASTSYGDAFKAYELPARLPFEPPPPRPSAAFDGTTTSREFFKQHEIEPRNPTVQRIYKPSSARFEGISEAHERFVEHPTLPREPPAPQPMRPSLPFKATTESSEAFRGWKLPPQRQALGLQCAGGKMYTLIKNGTSPPAVGRQIFTTTHDNQREICILIFQGNHQNAPNNKLIGQFDLVGIPEAPKGHPQIEVTFQVDRHDVLTASAVDLSSPERQEKWLLEGEMIARPLVQDIEVVTEPNTQTAISAH